MKRTRERLAEHTTFGLGGETTFWYPETMEDLEELAALPSPPRAIGRGSNILAADDGTELPDVCVIEMGVPEGRPAHELRAHGSIFELPSMFFDSYDPELAKFAAIPGTLGGLWATNAKGRGRFFREVADVGFQVGPYVLTIALPLAPRADRPTGGAEIARQVRRMARRVQPQGRSAGCVWRNPPSAIVPDEEMKAWALVDACGLKGARQGGAVISDKHATFIVAEEGATAQDVLDLMRMTREAVTKRFDVVLEPAVELWGLEL